MGRVYCVIRAIGNTKEKEERIVREWGLVLFKVAIKDGDG